jgi:hypothetical protein
MLQVQSIKQEIKISITNEIFGNSLMVIVIKYHLEPTPESNKGMVVHAWNTGTSSAVASLPISPIILETFDEGSIISHLKRRF